MNLTQNLKHFSVVINVLLIYLFVGLCTHSLSGQEKFNHFKHISTSDGFSLNSVNSIDQDERGLIWFGSRNGLMRYDGTNLKVIRREEGLLEEQGINDIYVIYVDSTAGVWTGSRYGISLYFNKSDSVRDFNWYQRISPTSSTRRVFDILRVNENEVWIGGGRGVEVFYEAQEKLIVNRHDAEDPNSINSNRVLCLYQSPKNRTIWVGTDRGLNQVISQKGGKLTFKEYGLGSKKDAHNVNDICEDQYGNLWVGTDDGLYLKKNNQEEFESFESAYGQKLTNRIVRCLTMDDHNRLWVGTYDGLNIIDISQGIISKIKHNPQKPNGLSGNNVRSLFTDRNGGVWIATYFGGVNFWSNNLLNFEKIDEKSGTQLGYNVVSSIVEDEQSNIYFGTEGSGITIYNSNTDKFSSITDILKGNRIGSVKVKDLLYEGDGYFWIGTFDQGVIHLNKKTGELKEYRSREESAYSLSSDRVITIEKALDGKLWVGTLNAGLDLLDPEIGKIRNFNASGGDPDIPYNNVRSLLVSKSGDLYVGTGAGLSFLSFESYKTGNFNFQIFELQDGRQDNLTIHDIVEDRSGRIWVATLISGLHYLKDGKLVSVELKGISSVFAIAEGKDGILWLSSEEGIVSFNPLTMEQQIFDRKDGVHPNEFNRGARLSASDGTIYFGGASGVTAFKPSSLGVTNDYSPNVVITRFMLSGKEITPTDGTDILDCSIEYTEEITLDYDQNIFTIHFAMPNYVNSDKNTYLYRLKGLDNSWTRTTNPFVSFTIQRGGSYEFEVKGVNSDGIESNKITSLEINVKNAPWLTIWAYLLYFIIIISSLITFIYFFKSRLRLQHKLEMETREFLHQQEVNQQKLQFFTNISHEFRTPLTLISGPLEKLLSDYKGPSNVFRQLLVIKKNTDQLFKLINELMDFRKLESKQMKLQAAEGNIVKFAKEIFLSFAQQAKINKIKYTFHSEQDTIKVYFDRDKLEKVLYNLISNAFKYTPSKGKVEVHVEEQMGMVMISVKDTGEGIEPDHLAKIFDRFYEIPKHKKNLKHMAGSGIGLAIAKNVMDLHKGDLSVVSEEGKGSDFIMKLRLGRDHLADDEVISSFKSSEDISQYVSHTELEDSEYGQVEAETANEDKEGRSIILIVEDNPDISRFMHNVLCHDYNIVLAENGANGFQEALSIQPDLIISDVMMPVMDGIEFCAKIKSDARTSHIPFILLTARTSLVYKYNGLESGADEYLSKPFEVKELVLKCKNIINTQERLKRKFAESGEFATEEVTVNSIDEVMMNKAIQIIRENIGNEFFGIQLLCDKLGISRSLLFTKFKAWTNQTPNDYILAARMKQAATLLEQNKVNISEVGYKVGFKSANYFSKSFKKYYSMSPKEYVKKFKNSLGIEE